MRASIYNAFPEAGVDALVRVHARVRARRTASGRSRYVAGAGPEAPAACGGAVRRAVGGGPDAASSSPRARRRRRRQRAGLDEAAPVLDDLRRAAVHVEPGQRVFERAAMQQRALGPRRRFHVLQPALHRQQLTQPVDVAPGDRQQPILNSGSGGPMRRRRRPPAPAARRSRRRLRPRRRRRPAASARASASARAARPSCRAGSGSSASAAPTRSAADTRRGRRARRGSLRRRRAPAAPA